jgi:hypothetical protein
MTFFARPDLSSLQFKQLVGSQLNLSGQTQILRISGLTLATDNIGGKVVITASGASMSTVGYVMTHDGTRIRLMESAASGTSIYAPPYKSPSTCTVGGLVAGTTLTGKTLSWILQGILVPTMNPVVTAPAITFTITPTTSTYEVGTSVNVTGSLTFNRGCISPQYCGSCCFRSGLPTTHRYQDFNGSICCCTTTALSSSYSMPARVITAGNNTAYGSVCYSVGPTPAYNSSGATFCTALPIGITAPSSQVLYGIYPYYYGKVASGGCPAGVNRPAATCALIISGTKIVSGSTGTLCINFNSTADDYIWFAAPNASTTKTKWYGDALNSGCIGGSVSVGGNLFPTPVTVCPVTTVCWSGQCYRLYISNYQTASVTIMELRNS